MYREEQKPLEDFFASKNLKIRNEMLDDVSFANCVSPQSLHSNQFQSSALIQAALNDADINSSEEEVVTARVERGSADEDDESLDEDFQSDSDSDVAEEYDSAHESSGSDEEMADGDDGKGSEDERAAEPKKKKAKTAK